MKPTLPIFYLFAIAGMLLFPSFLLYLVDRRRQKNRQAKKPSISFGWQVAGSLLFFLGSSVLGVGIYGCATFEGTEAGERHPLVSETLAQSDVLVVSSKYKADDASFAKKNAACARIINRRLSSDAYLSYTDQFYNKKKLYLSDITSAEGDPEMSARNMQIVQYLVTEQSGIFTLPRIKYYLVFGTQGGA